MAEDDAEVGGPQSLRRLDEFLFSKHKKLCPHQSTDLIPAGGGDHDDDRAQPHSSGRRRDGDNDQQEWHRDDDVGEAHQRVVQPAAVVTGQRPESAADEQVADDRQGAHHDRDARASRQPRQLVAAEVVGTQQVLETLEWRLEWMAIVLDPVEIARDDGHHDGGQHDDAQEQEGAGRHPVVEKPNDGQSPEPKLGSVSELIGLDAGLLEGPLLFNRGLDRQLVWNGSGNAGGWANGQRWNLGHQ